MKAIASYTGRALDDQNERRDMRYIGLYACQHIAQRNKGREHLVTKMGSA